MASVTAKRIPLIAGNWKMNFDHLQAIAFVQKLAWNLKDAHHDYADAEVALFPPFTALRSVQTLISADKLSIALGAQDVSDAPEGAVTGEVAAAFLAKLNCRYAIVGHSERRARHGETDALVAAKAQAALGHAITPVICVGESAADRETRGESAVPVEQLSATLDALESRDPIVVAYEPIWAIGSGTAATPEQAQTVAAALRQVVADKRGQDAAEATRILYGGSVKAANAAPFLREADIDGALVGGASLVVDEFSGIVRFGKHIV